jgi:hypothetical protein
MAVIGSLQLFTSILKIWLQSIQAFDQTEFLLLFDRISIAVTADDNTETCDRDINVTWQSTCSPYEKMKWIVKVVVLCSLSVIVENVSVIISLSLSTAWFELYGTFFVLSYHLGGEFSLRFNDRTISHWVFSRNTINLHFKWAWVTSILFSTA